MNLLARLFGTRASRAPAPAPGLGLVGRPTYGPGLGGGMTALRQPFDYSLLAEMVRLLPLFRRAVAMLSGFVGRPTLTGADDPHTERLNQFVDNVAFGATGRGLPAFMRDHLAQCLYYGYGVAEAEVTEARDGVKRLWSYDSRAFRFEASSSGEVLVVQTNVPGAVPLDMTRAGVTSLDTLGSDPRGQGLFNACLMMAEILIEAAAAHRQNLRRTGSTRYHLNWEPPADFDDPPRSDGTPTFAETFRKALADNWAEIMRKGVEEGQVNDFTSTGKVRVEPIGVGVDIMDFSASKRALMEELALASGIPPFLFGYSWSTTERMSEQQADTLTRQIKTYRELISPLLWKIIDLHQRLSGERRPYLLEWEAINLQDATETANAALTEAKADLARQEWARRLWAMGIWDQARVAEELTESEDVAVRLEEPPTFQQAQGQGTAEAEEPDGVKEERDGSFSDLVLAEMRAEYPGLGKVCGNGNGRH